MTYDFNGAKRITSPGRSEVSGREELTSFQNMTKMADAGQWQALLAESQRAVANSDGKWTGARAFNGIALVRVGKKDEGYAALAEVRTRLEALGGGSSDNRAFATALERAGTPALVYAIAGMEHVAVTRGLNLPGAPETFDPSAALWTSA